MFATNQKRKPHCEKCHRAAFNRRALLTAYATLGELIRHLRVTAGLTRRALGGQTDLAELTIRFIETGKREPHPATLAKLLRSSSMKTLPELAMESGLGEIENKWPRG